jgi:hypothetical protein
VRAVTPVEAYVAKNLPDRVLEVWNNEITKAFNGRCAHIEHRDIVEALVVSLNLPGTHAVKREWLNIEPIFEAAGWNVRYNRLGQKETHRNAMFIFTPRGGLI